MKAPTVLERAVIAQQLDAVRYGEDVAREIAALYESIRSPLIDQINRAAARKADFTEAHLSTILAQLDGNLVGLSSKVEGAITDGMKAVAQDSYSELSARFLEQRAASGAATEGRTVLGSAPLLPSSRIAELVREPLGGRPLAEWVSRAFSDQERAAIKQRIARSIVSGAGADAAARSLRTELGLSRNRADVIGRTAILGANNAALLETYKQNADVIIRFRWLATLDSRSCPQCGNLDGRESDKPDAWPAGPPPVHPRCRCVISPITKLDAPVERPAIREAEERVVHHKDGTTSTKFRPTQVERLPSTVTFPEFFASQPTEWQRAYLGAERFALLEAGKIKFSDLTSKADARVLTVAELKAKIAKKAEAVEKATARRLAAEQKKARKLIEEKQQAAIDARAKREKDFADVVP